LGLWENQIGAEGAKALATITKATRTNIITYKNTRKLKSTIVHTARALAKIAPALALEDQQCLAGNSGNMPNEVIAIITGFMEPSIEPHNLTTHQRLKLRLSAIEDGRKKPEADTARALTQEGVLAVEYVQPDYIAELITKLESLPSLPDHITKNDDRTYTYHYNAKNGAAELAEKPLNEITEDELTKLNSQIAAILARQQAAQEAGGQAEASTAASPKLSHVARLAEQRAQEEAREPQSNGI
jgi:hypothetical protein